MTIHVNDKYFNAYIKPLHYKLEISENEYIMIDIISVKQINEIEEKYKFRKLLIYCPNCPDIKEKNRNSNKKYYFIKDEELEKHEKHAEVCLKESQYYHILTKEEFNNFFKEEIDFIGKKLKPLEFEPNFSLYFKNSEYIIKLNEFIIFEDKYQKRMKIFDKINILNTANKLSKFFGQPGKGKTVTLIGILKYTISHSKIGTLYLNCKALSELDTFELKQLIIDEIPYLFYNNYNGYIECAKIIIDYIYDKNSSSFFDLINIIIDKIISDQAKKESYLIVFDQYKDKYDKGNKKLNMLYEELILNKSGKVENTEFGLITFSSMNNKDIRDYKIKYIFDMPNNGLFKESLLQFQF